MFARRPLTVSLSLVSLSLSAAAQVSLDWTGVFSGSPQQDHGTRVTDVAALPGGGVVASCWTWKAVWVYPVMVFTDIAADVVRWSEDGEQVWVTRIPGATSAQAVAVDGSGAITVATGGGSAQVHRLDANGALVWSRPLAGSYAQRIAIAPNGDVVAAGKNASTIAVARWTSAGTLLWSTALSPVTGTTGGDASWLALDGAGNSYVLGQVYEGSYSARVVAHDPAGQQQWAHVEAGYSPLEPAGALAPDGDVVFTRPPKIVRLAPDGSLRWQQDWTAAGSVWLKDVEVGLDGVVWALGSVQDPTLNPPPNHVNVRRYDPAGTLVSEDVYDPPERDLAFPFALLRGNAGQMYAAATVMIETPGSTVPMQTVALQYDASGQRNWLLTADAYPVYWGEQMGSAVLTSQHRLVMGGVLCGYCDTGAPSVLAAFDLAESPQGYCEGKVNSLGCTPAATFTGISSAGASSGFIVAAHGEIANKLGMLLYSVTGPAAVPFQGGTLCLQGPLLRTPAQSSGGSSGCDGSYAVDFNAFAHGLLGGNPDPALLTPGTTVWCQAWGRDPGFLPPDSTSLSNGLRYVVLP